MTILDEIATYAKKRVELAKEKVSLDKIKKMAIDLPKGKFELEHALRSEDISFICECKKASPSKGIIANNFDYIRIAKEYESAGASCISVLTEPRWFLGDDKYLRQIVKSVSIPCIRKDFIVDEYMIYETKLLGADAVLLIVSILNEHKLREYIKICDELGISALVEVHNEQEVNVAKRVGARIVGVNNRNLKDFTVDTSNALNLRDMLDDNIIFVSESGINSNNDIEKLKAARVDAVLVGEVLMRAKDKKSKLEELKGVR